MQNRDREGPRSSIATPSEADGVLASGLCTREIEDGMDSELKGYLDRLEQLFG